MENVTFHKAAADSWLPIAGILPTFPQIGGLQGMSLELNVTKEDGGKQVKKQIWFGIFWVVAFLCVKLQKCKW